MCSSWPARSRLTRATCSGLAAAKISWLTSTVPLRRRVLRTRADHIPSAWPGFEVEREFRGQRVTIKIANPNKKCRGITSLTVNGKKIAGNLLPLSEVKDGAVVEARLEG